MIKLDAIINDKKLLDSIQKGVDQYNKSRSGKSKLDLKINEKGFRQPLGRITGDLDKFESALAASNARVIAFGASTAVIGGITKAFKELTATTISVQKQFADINRILGATNEKFEAFGNSLFNIGKQTATAFDDVSKAALEFARQGLGMEETLKRTADALTLVRLTGVNADKAVSALTATVNAFQMSALTTTDAVNKFVAVETKFAVGARDLMDALGRVGSAAVDAKVNFDELNGMVAAVQQQTGRGGAVIGNALKTIFTRLQRKDTLAALESYGIAVRDVQGSTLPAMRILKDFAATYKTLEDSSKSYLREQVAGVFQANILSAIVKDLNSGFQVYNRAVQTSVGATNEADTANAKLNRTLSALISQTGTELVRLQENIGKVTLEPIARALLGPFKGIVESINNVLDGEGLGADFANGFLKGLRNIIAGPGMVAAIAIVGTTIFKTLSYITKALPTLVGITTETKRRANIEQTIVAMMQTDAGLATQIAKAEGDAAKQAGILLAAADKQAIAFKSSEGSITRMAALLASMGMTTGKMGTLTPKGRGAFGRGATGYIPGITGEMHDIAQGIGGVSSSAKPVHIPNFAFGGGVTGSMVANTGEHVIPNFRGSASAIFNPNMVGAFGLPQGAKKITASQGYVPNFADFSFGTAAGSSRVTASGVANTPIGGRYGGKAVTAADQNSANSWLTANPAQKATGAKLATGLQRRQVAGKKYGISVNAATDLELGAIVGIQNMGATRNVSQPFSKIKTIAGAKTASYIPRLEATFGKNWPKARLHLQGVPVKAIPGKVSEEEFRAKMNTHMGPSLHNLAADMFGTSAFKTDKEATAYIQGLKSGTAVFSKQAEGGIFESALKMTKSSADKFGGFSEQAQIDFNEVGPMDAALKKRFFPLLGGGMRADAKRTDELENIQSLAGKAIGDPILGTELVKRFLLTPKGSRGYIPNFAGGGLGAAIQREKKAGVPGSAIRIKSSPRFSTSQNPAGLAVTNTRDEPRGLRDIPNFAATDTVPKAGSGMGGFAMMMGAPMLGGMVEQGVGGRSGSMWGGALTGLGTGAGIGSMLLPGWGTAIGAVVGALGGVATAAMATAQSTSSLAKEFDDFSTHLQKTGTAAENYISAMEDIGLADTEKQLADATTRAEKAMSKLAGTELEAKFLAAGNNVDEMTEQLKGYTQVLLNERGVRTATLGLSQFGDKTGFTDKSPRTAAGGSGGFDVEKYVGLNRQFLGRVFDSMSKESIEKMQKELNRTILNESRYKDQRKPDGGDWFDRQVGNIDYVGAWKRLMGTFTGGAPDIMKIFAEYSEGVRDFTAPEIEQFGKFAEALDNMSVSRAREFNFSLQQIKEILGDPVTADVTSEIDRTADIQREFLQTISGLMDPYLDLMTSISRMNTAVGMNIAERSAILQGRLSLLKGTLAPTAEVDMKRGNAATAITQKRSVASAAFYKNNLNKIKTAMSERISGRGAVGAQELTTLLNTFITEGPQAGITAMRGAAGPMAGGKVEFETIQKAATDMQIAWDKADSVINKEERLNKIKFTIEELKARNLEREREMIIQQQQLSNAAKVSIAERQAGADLDIARLQFQLGDDRTFRGMSGVQRIGRKAEIEQNIRNIQRGMALTELERDQKEKAQDLKMREQLLARMKEETDTNLEQIEAIKVEISLTREMLTKQEELIQALKENTAALRKEEEGPKKPKGASEGSDRRRASEHIYGPGGPGSAAGPPIPGRRKELEKQATHLKAMITRDQAVSPEQQTTMKARQGQLKRINQLLAAPTVPSFEERPFGGIGALPGLGLLDTPPPSISQFAPVDPNFKRNSFLFSEWERAGKPSTFEKWVNTEGVNILNPAVVQGKAPPPKPPKPQRKHQTSWWSDSLDPALSDLGRISPDWTPGGPGAPGRALDPALVAIGRISPDWTPGESLARGGARTTGIPGTGGGGVGGNLGANQIQLTEIENTRQALVDLSNSEFESIRNTARGLLDNYDTEKKIFKVREDGKDVVEETLKTLRQQKHLQDTTFKGGWGKGMDKVRMDSETIFSLLGERLPVQMRDGMVTAMEAALDGAESFGDAMEGVAVGLLRTIRQAFLQSAATSIVGMFPGGKGKTDTKQKGGFIRAQNGMFVSGSGNGDRYPSLLEAGEYVLNRNAVSALGGPGALDTLNFGAAPRFQTGGGHRMNLAEKLPSTRMSGLFLSQGNPEYDDIAAAAVARLQKKQQKYQEEEDFKGMLISTLISAGISGAAGWAGSKMEGWGSGRPKGTTLGVDSSGRPVSKAPGKQSGGFIGNNNSVVSRYGLYQGGGSVPVAGAPSALGGGGNTNNVSINIDLGGNATGGGTGGSQSPTGNTGAPQAEGQNPADAKALGEKIKSQVLKIIAQEQRVGGSLSPSARKGG